MDTTTIPLPVWLLQLYYSLYEYYNYTYPSNSTTPSMDTPTKL